MARKRKTYKKIKKKRTIAGVSYSFKMCHKLKSSAVKSAKIFRREKKLARIIRVKKRHCVYVRG